GRPKISRSLCELVFAGFAPRTSCARYNLPVRRILLTLAAILATAIFLASIVMWVRSYWHDDQLQRVVVKNLPSRNEDVVSAPPVRLSSSRGKVALALMRSRTPHPFEASPTVALHAG